METSFKFEIPKKSYFNINCFKEILDHSSKKDIVKRMAEFSNEFIDFDLNANIFNDINYQAYINSLKSIKLVFSHLYTVQQKNSNNINKSYEKYTLLKQKNKTLKSKIDKLDEKIDNIDKICIKNLNQEAEEMQSKIKRTSFVYKCTECIEKKFFSDKSSLFLHIRSSHNTKYNNYYKILHKDKIDFEDKEIQVNDNLSYIQKKSNRYKEEEPVSIDFQDKLNKIQEDYESKQNNIIKENEFLKKSLEKIEKDEINKNREILSKSLEKNEFLNQTTTTTLKEIQNTLKQTKDSFKTFQDLFVEMYKNESNKLDEIKKNITNTKNQLDPIIEKEFKISLEEKILKEKMINNIKNLENVKIESPNKNELKKSIFHEFENQRKLGELESDYDSDLDISNSSHLDNENNLLNKKKELLIAENEFFHLIHSKYKLPKDKKLEEIIKNNLEQYMESQLSNLSDKNEKISEILDSYRSNKKYIKFN